MRVKRAISNLDQFDPEIVHDLLCETFTPDQTSDHVMPCLSLRSRYIVAKKDSEVFTLRFLIQRHDLYISCDFKQKKRTQEVLVRSSQQVLEFAMRNYLFWRMANLKNFNTRQEYEDHR